MLSFSNSQPTSPGDIPSHRRDVKRNPKFKMSDDIALDMVHVNADRISFGKPGMFKMIRTSRSVTENEDVNPGVELNSVDSTSGENFTLFSGVARREAEDVRRALHDGSDVNARSVPMGVTVLHIASSFGDENIVNMLLKAGADPSAADKLGRTPLHMAASAGSDECLLLLLKAGASPNSEYHVNTLPTVVNDSRKQSSELRKGMIPLETLGLELPFPECWGRTPLHQAVKSNSPECVQRLLEAGAEVDPADESGMTPLLLAGSGGQLKEKQEVERYEEVVEALLSYGARVDTICEKTGHSPLHVAATQHSVRAAELLLKHGANPVQASEEGNWMTAIHLAAELASCDVLSAILKSAVDDYRRHQYANVTNDKGCTPIHMAAYAGCHSSTSLLIDSGADLGAVTDSGISALDAVFLYLPRPAPFLCRVLDSRIKPNAATVEQRSFAIQLDFRVLAPHGKERQTGVMRALLEAESPTDEIRRTLLSHPVVEAFIVLKWRRLRLFFYLLVSVYLLFALSLSVYISLIHTEDAFAYYLNNTGATEGPGANIPESRIYVVVGLIKITRPLLMASSVVVLLNVFGQCCAFPKYYLKQFEMWMNLVSAMLAIYLAQEGARGHIAAHMDERPATDATGNSLDDRIGVTDHYTSSEVIHLTSVTILLAWAELMLLIGRFPTWGSHGLLFYAVLKNVIKVLLAFGCLVIGFAFSFFVQFHRSQPQNFGNPWRAFVKTMVMMMGEFEYQDLFEEKNKYTLPMTSRVIFVCFVILASIVLVNLMVGLAVSDTQALRSEGEARRLLKQAEFVAHLERGVSAVIRSKWLPGGLIKWLSKRRAIDTMVVVRPSDSANAPAHRAGRHLPRRLLEDLVAIALRRREGDRRRAKTQTSDGLPNYLFNSANDTMPDIDMVLTLQRISTSLTEIKDMLEPRFGLSSNAGPAVLKTRKWSSARAPRARFSDLVAEVTGAQRIMTRLSGNDSFKYQRQTNHLNP
ncbi:transient receptor potential channel pyrexia-like [Ischnura elegans]|uniref:transient receptor potential channel pyrexia-like n=1 Tax=Ischnura elegans TaxID=197161 RepID=UPI001ED8BBFC|nr:transient receptor potential channel pyrexia-like [Ischnura elegans]